MAIAMLLGAAPAAAAELYVAVDGSDAALGTENAPFATLQRAQDQQRTERGRSGGGQRERGRREQGEPDHRRATPSVRQPARREQR